jgi:hypothetical protein
MANFGTSDGRTRNRPPSRRNGRVRYRFAGRVAMEVQ